jgi:HAD superfamily phosphoserine phosphatase-like hydrolase
VIGALSFLLLSAPAPVAASACMPKPLLMDPIELPRGRWSEEVHARLVEMMREQGASSPRYDPCHRPLAVFDFDNTVIAGDLGDSAFADALEEGLLAPDAADLRTLLAPLAPAHATALAGLWPRAKWPAAAQPPSDLRWQVHRAYDDLCREKGNAVGYPWLTQVFAGWTEAALSGFAERTIARELARTIVADRIEGGGEPVTVVRGIRARPEMTALIAALTQAGFDVYIVSASPEWLVRAYAPRLGLSRDRVIGMRATATATRTTANVDTPSTYRAGKVAAIRSRVPPGGRVPVFAAGDALTDLEMMEEASDLALFIDRGDPTVRARAEARGWAVQRPFESETAPATEAPGRPARPRPPPPARPRR